MNLFNPAAFTTHQARVLPVFLLLDTSSSMYGAKMASLNAAVPEMLESFRRSSSLERAITVAVITFSEVARVHLPLTPVAQMAWSPLRAHGNTPMGAALQLTKTLVEDRQLIPAHAWRPTLVLLSDGQPTDEWRTPLHALVREGRSAKCDRMAMALGDDAQEAVLTEFLGDAPHPLYHAANAGQIPDFFRFVTMSVTLRANSVAPHQTTPAAVAQESTDGAFF